jgi:hypothetical protein
MRTLITLLELVQELAVLVYRRLRIEWLEYDLARLHAEQRNCMSAAAHLADLTDDVEYLISNRTGELAAAKSALAGQPHSEAA